MHGFFLGAPSGILENIIIAILFLMVPFVLLKKGFRRAFRQDVTWKKACGLCYVLLVMVYIGLFGGGSGSLGLFAIVAFFGLPLVEVMATDMLPFLVVYVLSYIVFAVSGIVDYAIGIPLLLGMTAGGYVGANLAVHEGNRFVHYLFAFVVLASAVKLLVG